MTKDTNGFWKAPLSTILVYLGVFLLVLAGIGSLPFGEHQLPIGESWRMPFFGVGIVLIVIGVIVHLILSRRKKETARGSTPPKENSKGRHEAAQTIAPNLRQGPAQPIQEPVPQPGSVPKDLTIDLKHLMGPGAPVLPPFSYEKTPTVDDLLDNIWNSIPGPRPGPGTYGDEWILCKPDGTHYFHEIGIRWAQLIEGEQRDKRLLEDVGIMPGMTLEVRPLKQPFLVINPRPFRGTDVKGGGKVLSPLYSDLRTVDGLLNRIEISTVPNLPARSYKIDWILFNPASGQYFDEIYHGDKRDLEAAGIKRNMILEVRDVREREKGSSKPRRT